MASRLSQAQAEEVVESLRTGIPPHRNVSSYAAGTGFVEAVSKRHLRPGIDSGKIRFVSGSWGAGKTHFFRMLREHAFEANLLVSTVELNADQAPFNKFEKVFYEIVRNVASPRMYSEGSISVSLPFGEVLQEALRERGGEEWNTPSVIEEACEELFAQTTIDIDFRRVVASYWRTFAAQDGSIETLENIRGLLLQWFQGEVNLPQFRREFGVQKVVAKDNARIILNSLGLMVKWLGFGGLLILLDESEMTHSTMSRSNLKQAHNNLLHLINEIDESTGLFLIYAAVPQFYTDPKSGITQYGALAARIGRPEDHPPRSLERVWNIDQLAGGPEEYVEAACRIREVYLTAYPEASEDALGADELATRITELAAEHPEFSSVSAWRVMITGTIDLLDASADGASLPEARVMHESIMSRLRDE